MKAILLLSDGTVFKGTARGKCENTTGEVVFNTSMIGYQEILTDPTYYGQLVAMTFPLMGNYGINDEDFESDKTCLKGFITRDISDFPSNFRCKGTLNDYLIKNNITAIEGIDTRALTRLIRDKGCLNGSILVGDVTEELINKELEKLKEYKIENPVKEVSSKENKRYEAENAKYEVVLYDFGCKNNIIASLNKCGCNVTLVPYNTSKEEILKLKPDGIMLSNGPGNPMDLIDITKNIKAVIEENIPVFGVCLGHQLVALAMGFETEKLKYGHRGASQPVKDVESGRTYITSQNHGYSVKESSIDKKTGEISHININDNTVEGIKYNNYPVFTVQFNPEVSESMVGTTYLFDKFVSLMEGNKNA